MRYTASIYTRMASEELDQTDAESDAADMSAHGGRNGAVCGTRWASSRNSRSAYIQQILEYHFHQFSDADHSAPES